MSWRDLVVDCVRDNELDCFDHYFETLSPDVDERYGLDEAIDANEEWIEKGISDRITDMKLFAESRIILECRMTNFGLWSCINRFLGRIAEIYFGPDIPIDFDREIYKTIQLFESAEDGRDLHLGLDDIFEHWVKWSLSDSIGFVLVLISTFLEELKFNEFIRYISLTEKPEISKKKSYDDYIYEETCRIYLILLQHQNLSLETDGECTKKKSA